MTTLERTPEQRLLSSVSDALTAAKERSDEECSGRAFADDVNDVAQALSVLSKRILLLQVRARSLEDYQNFLFDEITDAVRVIRDGCLSQERTADRSERWSEETDCLRDYLADMEGYNDPWGDQDDYDHYYDDGRQFEIVDE